MRPKKRSKAAREREAFKKRRVDSSACLSEGSCYAPSESETDSNTNEKTKSTNQSEPAFPTQARDALRELVESETSDQSESDGEILLQMDDELDENDWDPEVVPEFYPIFTHPTQGRSFRAAERSIRAPVYTKESRTTKWQQQVSEAKRAEAARSCADIRGFFTPQVKDPPCTRNPSVDQTVEPALGHAECPELPLPNNPRPPQSNSPSWCPANILPPPESSIEANQTTCATRAKARSSSSESAGLGSSLLQAQSEVEGALAELRFTSPRLPDCVPDEQQPEAERDQAIDANCGGCHLPSNDSTVTEVGQSTPDASVGTRLEELRQKLAKMKAQIEKEMKTGRKKIDPRDPADIQALMDYCILAEGLYQDGCRSPEMTASLQIARTKVSTITKDGNIVTKGAWFARTLRSKAKHVRDLGELPARQQGKGAAHSSLLDRPLVKSAVNKFIDSAGVGKVSPQSLMREVNTNILPTLSLPTSSISENTAKRWLLRLGFRRDSYRKGVYMDGHEREDVVEYRKTFLDKVLAYEPQMQQYSDKDCEPIPLILPPGKRQIVPAFHDECCFHANDQSMNFWLREGQTLLRQKGRGRLIHVSDIIVEGSGRLVLSDEEIKMQKALPERQRLKTWDARKIIYPGKNQDPFWDMPQLISQANAIKIFEVKYPGAQMLLFVDQSSAHNAYAADALNARKMNVGPGGKQPMMHDTRIPDNNPNPMLRGKLQTMVFDSAHPKDANKPKGMEQVLKERGLWDLLKEAAGGKRPVGRCKACKSTAAEREKVLAEAQAIMDENPDSFGSIDNVLEITHNESLESTEASLGGNRFCCMEKCLSTESDFMAEKPLLQLVVEDAGHLCVLLPKFHCELNPIEMLWGHAKHKFRAQCNGSFPLARELVPKCLDSCSVTTIRRFFQKTWRYMDAYRHGLTGLMAEHAVKQYASHQKISKRVMMEVAMLAR